MSKGAFSLPPRFQFIVYLVLYTYGFRIVSSFSPYSNISYLIIRISNIFKLICHPVWLSTFLII